MKLIFRNKPFVLNVIQCQLATSFNHYTANNRNNIERECKELIIIPFEAIKTSIVHP